MTTKELVNEYYNQLTDLQKKRKKDKETFIFIALLLIFIIEDLTTTTTTYSRQAIPLLNEIDLENVEENVKNFDLAIKGKGDLQKPFLEFKTLVTPTLNYITNSVELPPKSPILGLTKKSRYEQLEEESQLKAITNNISLMMNQMIFQKSFKIWNTQNDELVRNTTFHNSVRSVKVAINDYFEVGVDRAMYPNDTELPVFERYNCRCYLTYE